MFLSVHSFYGTFWRRLSALHGHEPIGEIRIVSYTHPCDANEFVCPGASGQLQEDVGSSADRASCLPPDQNRRVASIRKFTKFKSCF